VLNRIKKGDNQMEKKVFVEVVLLVKGVGSFDNDGNFIEVIDLDNLNDNGCWPYMNYVYDKETNGNLIADYTNGGM